MVDDVATAGRSDVASAAFVGLATVVSSTRDPCLLLDARGVTILAANEACAQRVGRRSEELVGLDWRTLFDPALSSARFARMQEAIARCAPVDFDDVRGSFEIEHRMVPIVEGGLGVRYMMYTARDVTERNRSREALSASEERYHRLFEEAGDAIFVSDLHGRHLEVNERACVLLGRTRDELLELRARDLLQPEEAARAEAWMAKAPVGDRIAVSTQMLHRTRGWITVEFTCIRLSDGKVQAIVRDVTEQREADERLRAQTARLVAAERIANVGTMELDFATGEAIWSEQAYRILEIPPSKTTGLFAAFLARVHPDDRPGTVANLERVLQTGFPIDWTFRAVMDDGRVKHLRRRNERVELQSDGDPPTVRLLGTIEDITERVHAELERTRREHEYYRMHEVARLKDAAVEAALNAVALADLTGKLTYVNPAFLRMWGFDNADRVVGRSVLEFWENAERASNVVSVVARGANWTGELTARRGDGSTFIALLAATMLRDAEGHPTQLLASFVDVTERALVEEDLRTHAHVLNSMVEGVCFVDETLTIRFANRSLHTLFGYEPGQLVGMSINELDDATDVENEAFYAQMLADIEGSGEWQGEFRNRRRNGEEFYTHARVTFLARNERRWFVIVEEDITERKRAEQENARALREKETLVREVHHRVKNNLQVICSLLSLQRSALVEEQSRVVLQDCEDRVRIIAMIHEQLHQSSDLSTLDLGAHLSALVAKIGYGSTDKIVCVTYCDQTILVGMDAAVPIGFVLHELLMNAHKHAFPDRPGLVRVSCRRLEDTLIVAVRDDGVGLPSDWRSRSHTSLGLSLVEALAQQLDGTFEIRSEHGTVAILRVPLCRTRPMGSK